jgi:CRP-like cAMP-binding protein
MPSTLNTPNRHLLVQKLERGTALTADERQAVAGFPIVVRTYAKGQDIVREGDSPYECCQILDGFAYRYKLLDDGRRQIIAFHPPGDMPDLQSLYLKVMDHTVAALAPTTAAFIPNERVRDLAQRFPGLQRAFWRDILIGASIQREDRSAVRA